MNDEVFIAWVLTSCNSMYLLGEGSGLLNWKFGDSLQRDIWSKKTKCQTCCVISRELCQEIWSQLFREWKWKIWEFWSLSYWFSTWGTWSIGETQLWAQVQQSGRLFPVIPILSKRLHCAWDRANPRAIWGQPWSPEVTFCVTESMLSSCPWIFILCIYS